jgi:hypothetical protein
MTGVEGLLRVYVPIPVFGLVVLAAFTVSSPLGRRLNDGRRESYSGTLTPNWCELALPAFADGDCPS